MKIHRQVSKRYKLGWWVGDFEPSILKTKAFELAVKHHKAGEDYECHAQKKAREWTYLISGKMSINDIELRPDDIIEIEPMEFTKPKFQTDCHVFVLKVPSLPGDKIVKT